MPGIFVDPDSTFPITIYYKDVLDAKGNEVCVDTWASEDDNERPEGDGWRTITVKFRQVDTKSFGAILEEATIINHVNQKPTLRTKILREQVLFNYAVSWDVGKDGHGGCDEKDAIPMNLGLLLESKWSIGNKLFIEYMVRSKMMDAVRVAMADDQNAAGNMGQPFLSADIFGNTAERAMPGFPPMPDFPPMPGFPPTSGPSFPNQ